MLGAALGMGENSSPGHPGAYILVQEVQSVLDKLKNKNVSIMMEKYNVQGEGIERETCLGDS